jgi:hypothetical protein
MKKLIAALCLVPSLAWGQAAVRQSGVVSNNDMSKWTTSQILQSAGSYLGDQTGLGVNPFAITDNKGNGLCFYTAAVPGVNPFCIGHDSNSNISFTANGTSYQFPFVVGGIVGPGSTTVGHPAVWNNTIGTLLTDTTVLTTTQLLNSTNNLVTTQTVPAGSVGQGALYFNTVRSGGFGQYGNSLVHYEVSTAIPGGQFDVGSTTWANALNLTGGNIFGSWSGANTPARNLGQTYTVGAAVGEEINFGNRWSDFGIQTDVGGTRYTVGLQVVPDVLPATGIDNSVALTSFASGSPAVFTLNAHGFYANMGVVFEGTAGITGISDGVTYFVIPTGLTANNFEVSATIGGSAVNTTGSSGTIAVLPSWPGSFGIVTSQSAHGHQIYVGQLTRFNALAPGGYAHLDNGGTIAGGAPARWANVGGNWVAGLDFTTAAFSTNIAISLAAAQQITFVGGATLTGGTTIGLTPVGNGVAGTLFGNNFSSAALQWGGNGSAQPELGFFGASLQLQPTGYGTPTGVALVTNFPGATATLGQTSSTLAALITNLKTLGIIGN